jgi:hypothetical protein
MHRDEALRKLLAVENDLETLLGEQLDKATVLCRSHANRQSKSRHSTLAALVVV